MAMITTRKLSRNTASVIDELAESGEPVLIVRNGQPVAVLSAVDPQRAEQAVVASAPEVTAALERADRAAESGETKSFEQIFGSEPSEGGEGGAAIETFDLGSVSLEQLAGEVVERAPLELEGLSAEHRAHVRAVARQTALLTLTNSVVLMTRWSKALNAGILGAEEGEVESGVARKEEMLALLEGEESVEEAQVEEEA